MNLSFVSDKRGKSQVKEYRLVGSMELDGTGTDGIQL